MALRPSALAAATLAGIALFLALVAALHVLEPRLDPVRNVLSRYGVSPSAPLFTAALLVVSAGIPPLALAMRQVLQASAWRDAGLALLVLAAAGIAVAGVVPMDLPGSAPTAAGALHRGGAAAGFVAALLALLALGQAFGRDARWRDLRWPALAAALVGGADLLLLARGPEAWEGATQRAYVAIVVGALAVGAWRVRRLDAGRQP